MPPTPLPAPLIVITGSPAAGKTTLARALGDLTGWPVLHRDRLKEILLDDWGAADRNGSRRIGGISWSLFHHLLGELAGRAPLIVDANLTGPGIDRVRPLIDRPGAVVLHCHADHDTLRRRMVARRDDPTRHAGHFDADAWPELAAALARGDYAPVDWPCPSLVVDTTAHGSIDLDGILTWLATVGGIVLPERPREGEAPRPR